MYDIRWDQAAHDDMKDLKVRAFDVALIVDAVEEQLTHEAERKSKRRKQIRPGEQLPFEHEEPVWQLRVGEFRVFYDVLKEEKQDEAGECKGVVRIRAIRRNPPHKTTREIL
ncbi:MAG: hypothetical protein HY040_18595 [Planctomycetes bacterium]|nr:hypothetical protein [Planctomycetota bacterium]